MNSLEVLVITNVALSVLILVVSKHSPAQGSLCSDNDFYLEFSPSSQQASVKIAGETDIKAFTICVWLKTPHNTKLGILRYSDEAGSEVRIALSLNINGNLFFSLFSGSTNRKIDVLPGVQNDNWHGLCVTWRNKDGSFMVYYQGRLLQSGEGFQTGESIPSNGIFILGVGAHDGLKYSGRLGRVNAWPYVLEHPQLAVFSSKCGVERGELVSWPQFSVHGVKGNTCPFNEVDITDEVKHWKLDGGDQELTPKYSASFLEGRLDGHKAVYLDQTAAYVQAPYVQFGANGLPIAFTIACWIKLLPSNPYNRAILSSQSGGSKNGRFFFGVNSANKLQLEHWNSGTKHVEAVGNSLQEKQWHHVAVSYATSVALAFFVNGFEHPGTLNTWQNPASDPFDIGRYFNLDSLINKFQYFHGFLSDLYVFSRALNVEEIGKMMGRSSPCTHSEWASRPTLTPRQTPTEKYRTKSCPGIGECQEVRAWKPADCREVLLSGNKTNGIYTISPLNNEDEFEVFCDQETQGGGWTVIQQRRDGTVNFLKTWNEYKTGFGTVGSESEMWLGNDKIHSLTTKNTELLIQLEDFDGKEGFAIYSDFYVGGEDDLYRLSLGEFSGNLPNKLGMHNASTFKVESCTSMPKVGWWFTSTCGEVLLNSKYGKDIGSMKWSDFPNEGDTGGKLQKTSMKIRRTEGYFEDYTLKFPRKTSDSSDTNKLLWPTVLTEFKAFTVCLWLKVQIQTDMNQMILLRYYKLNDGNFSVMLNTKEGSDPKLIITIWPSTGLYRKVVNYFALDGSWHHVCVSWTNLDGKTDFYMDNTHKSYSDIGNGTVFSGGGRILVGGTLTVNNPPQLVGEITYMNLWDKVLSEAFIENLAHACEAETGNVLQWSFFAAMVSGNVQYVPSSGCSSKELYHWTFDNSSTKDTNKNHIARMTGARISADQHSLVIEDQGHFMAENMSSDLSTDQGFTVSFPMKQTVIVSDILQDDFKSLEVLRAAFPTFVRDHAVWKRCYSADNLSWRTSEFHSNCDHKGPSLTVIRVGQYVFGGFVEQSWGGRPSDIGNQFEGFLFSLSNPSNQSPRFFPIQQGKASGRTDTQLGPSFGERDLELFEDEHGRLMGFSGLGAAFNVTSVSMSSAEARTYFAGSQHFYPDQVEVFYYHVPSKPVGLENGTIPDSGFISSSYGVGTQAYLARLNELRYDGHWCSGGASPSEWLQVFLGKQYTLTHIALQGIGGDKDVTTFKVKYEKTKDGTTWITYSKLIDGTVTDKVLRFNMLSPGVVIQEAFFPPFEAVKVQLDIPGQKVLCMKMELYVYDAGCSQAHGLEDGKIPDEKLTASSTEIPDHDTNKYYWPMRGRLNHAAGSKSWGPYDHDDYGNTGNWFQVDLQKEEEVTCVATQGVSNKQQWPTKYQIAFSSEGNNWTFYELNNAVKEFDANSDSVMAVTNWLAPSVYGRFVRVHITHCHKYCRLRMELYGKHDLAEIFPFRNGLGFTVRRGRYHIFFAKDNFFWEIRHPLIVNQWFEATLSWTPNDGLKFYVNGDLVASDKTPVHLNLTLESEPFKLMIGSAENGGGWSRAISIADVSVWKMARTEEVIKRTSEVHLDFDDNSRNWTLLLNSSSGWKLSYGCTETEGTGPCNNVSGGGRYIYFDASQHEGTGRFVTPSNINSYACLTFYYHMTGMHVGRLNIYTKNLRGNEELLWRLFGEQTDEWKEAKLPIDGIHAQYQVIFEAVKESGYLGDIAVDQISFTREKCKLLPSSAAPQNFSESGVVISSSIISMDSAYHQYMGLMLKEEGYNSSRWIPCYRALHHGWNVSTFHRQCDNKGPTLSIVRKDNYVFGGFTERSWGEDLWESYDLHFWRKDIHDYIRADLPTPISQFTVSLWAKISSSPITLFSLGTDNAKLQVVVKTSSEIHLCYWINSASTSCSVIGTPGFLVGFWHQLTVIWDSLKWELYIDATYRGMQQIANVLSITGGSLFIGQLGHPASDNSESFVGQMTSFNMWDYRLDAEAVVLLAQSCINKPGNVFQWNTLKDKVHGELKLVKPSTCQLNTTSNYDLYFWRKDSNDFVKSVSPLSVDIINLTASLWMKTSHKSHLTLFAFGTADSVHLRLVIKVDGKLKTCAHTACYEAPKSQDLVDGFWHQITILWHGNAKTTTVYVDGVTKGPKHHSSWTVTSIPQGGTLSIGRSVYNQHDVKYSFTGRITLFNMWDHLLGESDIAMLARSCRGAPQGNMFQWSSLKDKVLGQLRIVEPSSCSSTNYRSDTKAFIFSLNYTSQGTLFKKEISEKTSAFAIYSSQYTGPTFGEFPFDFQIGINGSMRYGSSHHVISYEGGENSTGSNLETVLAGASSFDVSDVEVLYKDNGGSLCPQPCPFSEYCDEISGGCRCSMQDKNLALCQLLTLYKDCVHFWPLDSVEEIKDYASPGWGQSKGGVSKTSGLTTDGVDGEILLNHEGDSCATKFANYSCDDPGFTVALWLKRWNRDGGGRQTFFRSLGKFVLYQEGNANSLIVRVQRATKYCLKEITMPEQIWSYLVFTYKTHAPETLTVYRNGQRIHEFIRDEGCNKMGVPEFSSSSISLSAGDGVFAKATYYHIAIWQQVLPDEKIAQIYSAYKDAVFPLSVRVVAQIENQAWHEDLKSPETERYTSLTNDIKSNVTSFYSNYPGLQVSVAVDGYRNGSVIAEFTIMYNASATNFSLIEELNQSIASTSHLHNMPLKLKQLTPENVPYQSPPNVRATRVGDTSIDITWDNVSLSPAVSDVFQGFKVFIRLAGSTEVNITTINEIVNTVTLPGLEPLATYSISVAAYTLAAVGKESESIVVNTTIYEPPANILVASVTSKCVIIQWDGVPPEKFGFVRGYGVFYALENQPSFSMNTTVNSSTHRVEICDLQGTTKYKYYVQRALLTYEGNRSDVQYFTTLTVLDRIKFPPTDVTAYNTSSTSIFVHWQPPSSEDIAISTLRGYEVFFKPRLNASASWETIIACNNTSNATIRNLEKYTEYDIVVAAFNEAGPGNFSKVTSCFTDEDIPLGGPVNISAHDTGSTSINISWIPVLEPLRLGIITKYIFNITDVVTGALTTAAFDGASLNGEVRNLSKYQEYSITGAAANSKGQSNFTDAITCRTGEDAPDLPPANVTAYNTSSTSIMVEFQTYPSEGLNGIIRRYNFKVFKADVVDPAASFYTVLIHHARRRRSTPDNVVKVLLGNLTEYTMFSIQAAFFTVRNGPYSAVVNASTDEGVPRVPPLQVTAFNTSSSSILVTWQQIAPASVPGILLGYVLRIIKADDVNASNFVSMVCLSTTKNVTHLETFTLYNISVAGFTRIGFGNFSVVHSWTDEGVPEGPPNDITGSPTSTTSITLSWLPVTKELQKGIIRGYHARIYDASGLSLNTTKVFSPSLSAYFSELDVYSNYSLQVRAFTRKGLGPWSSLVNVSTGAPAPNQIPMNATADATGPYTIHVTWSPVSVVDARNLHGYRVRYFPVHTPHIFMDIMAGRNDLEATIPDLKPFTLYGVKIAAFSTEDGNYTTPVYAKTWEAVPSAPPTRLGISVRDSQSLLVYWLDVPPEHRNGVIRGYRLTYRSASNGTSSVITKRVYSEVLTQLQKATEYTVEVWAYNNAGDGISDSYTATTGEDVPSKPPSNIIAENYTSLTSIPISWDPVPQEFVHGSLVGYRVTYQAVYIGDLPVDYEPVISKDVGNAVTSMTLQNLETLVVYRITVAAISNKGPGPKGVTFGETCRCRPHLTTNWKNYPPYVNLTSLRTPGIIIPFLLVKVIDQCCGNCSEHGLSKLDFRRNGNNGIAQQNTSEDLLQNIDDQTDFSFPVIGYKLQDSYKGGLGYAPFVESAGVAFVVYTDTSGFTDVMFAALLACWPAVVLPLVMAYIAGVTVWMLDAKSNNQHFPPSFIYGTWEGVWWAFVSMTTVGYGDRTPISHLGRVFAVGWVLAGLVIISVTMGALTTALTTITADSEPTIYGSKVGAIHGSPEYNLGVRRNAIMNKDKHYHTLEELSEALINRDVDGVLIDTYAGGTHRDLFSKPSLRVTQIIDYQTAYGVVIGGDSMRLRHCFYGYMRSHQAEIFEWVDELVEPIKGSGLSDEEFVQDISTGLFDSKSDLFYNTLLITGTLAITAFVLGLFYEAIRRIRGRQKVQRDNTLSIRKEKMIEEMRSILNDFFQSSMKTLTKMKARHKKELLKHASLAPKTTRRLESAMTNSSTMTLTREYDDISMIELEDLRTNSSKC